VIVYDYREICRNPKFHVGAGDQVKVVKVGMRIARGVYRCSILGILSATCIKLNAVYLISDAENILTWMINDALTVVGLRTEEWSWLSQNPSAFMTSFFVLFITCFIFLICLAQISRVIERVSTSKPASGSVGAHQVEGLVSEAKVSWLKMIGVVILLAANFFLIGQFAGFSLLLAGSVIVAIFAVSKRVVSSV
jgi:hypothetical protein